MEQINSYNNNLGIRRTMCYIVLIILTIVSLFPFYVMLVNCTRMHMQIQAGFAFLPGKAFIRNFLNLSIDKTTEIQWLQDLLEKYGVQLSSKNGNYAENYPIIRGMVNSLFVSICVAAFTTYFSAMTSYGIYMYNFKMKRFSFRFILAVMMVPTQVSTLGFLRLLNRLNLMDSFIPLIVPAIAAPIVFFYMYQSMEATLPYSVVEAARVDGCHEFMTFNRIVVPMMKPAFAVQAIFSFVSSWNNYFVPALILEKEHWTVPIVIANARNADYMNNDQGINYMLMTFAIVPVMIIYFCLSKYIISGVTAGGVKE